MDALLIILGMICMFVGLIGCILPILPGLPIAYVGLLMLHFTDKVQFTTTQLLIWLLVVIVMQVLDYFTPLWGSKYTGGSKWGRWGCLIGTVVGIFFFSPWGIVIGPFLGAFIGEILGDKSVRQAIRSGIGALIGFLLGTVLKCIVCGYFIFCFFRALWS